MVVQYVPSSVMPVQFDGSVPKVVMKGGLKSEDQVALYEALASIVAGLPPEQLRPALQMLLQGPVGNLSEILAAAHTVATDMQGYAAWAGRSIEAIATVSKAFA